MKILPPSSRDAENPDPHELHRPVPKVLLIIIAALLSWAVYYIVSDSPGLGSSSATQPAHSPHDAKALGE